MASTASLSCPGPGPVFKDLLKGDIEEAATWQLVRENAAQTGCHYLSLTLLLEVNICFHPKFILQVNSHSKPFKMRYIS